MDRATLNAEAADPAISPLISLLRCLACRAELELVELIDPGAYDELGPDGQLRCTECGTMYPIIAGTVRALPPGQLAELWAQYPKATRALQGVPRPHEAPEGLSHVRRETVEGFAYEWEQFGGLRDEWRKNFLDYMQPHDSSWFDGRLIADVGAGSGRHSFHANALGARVVTVDLGRAIDVARRNLPASVLTVQAAAEHLPFEYGQFDMVASIGVLPVVPDPEETFRSLVPYARRGGHVHIYVYWIPLRAWHRVVLAGVTAARRITSRLPHRLLHALCIPLSVVLYALFILPYRFGRSRRGFSRLAETLPLKIYADYPFGVCVNDQFDRLSVPIEHRHTQDEVRNWYKRAGLEDIVVVPNFGWVADGRRRAHEGQ